MTKIFILLMLFCAAALPCAAQPTHGKTIYYNYKTPKNERNDFTAKKDGILVAAEYKQTVKKRDTKTALRQAQQYREKAVQQRVTGEQRKNALLKKLTPTQLEISYRTQDWYHDEAQPRTITHRVTCSGLLINENTLAIREDCSSAFEEAAESGQILFSVVFGNLGSYQTTGGEYNGHPFFFQAENASRAWFTQADDFLTVKLPVKNPEMKSAVKSVLTQLGPLTDEKVYALLRDMKEAHTTLMQEQSLNRQL